MRRSLDRERRADQRFRPVITARNTATAAVKEYLLDAERQQHSQLRRMAQRLSLFTSLAKYALGGSAAMAYARRRLPVHARCPISCGLSRDPIRGLCTGC
jgi:hypothetical protein